MVSLKTTIGDAIGDAAGIHFVERKAESRAALWAFRIATGLLMGLMGLTGVANVLRPEPVLTALHHLGYPDYFPIMLGTAKLLAVVALALPGTRRLKEWAYAGMTFDVLAGFVSHLAVHDELAKQVPLILVLVALTVSYAGHRRRSRMVELGPDGAAA